MVLILFMVPERDTFVHLTVGVANPLVKRPHVACQCMSEPLERRTLMVRITRCLHHNRHERAEKVEIRRGLGKFVEHTMERGWREMCSR